MSFDPSRTLYAHPTCNTIPCTCVREHTPLDAMTFYCTIPHCRFYGETVNQLQEHRLERHSFQQPLITTNGASLQP